MSNFSLTHELVKYRGKTVGMGCAITTKNVSSAEEINTSLLYFTQLLPSFCKTASPGYFYRFYMGYDFNDTILSTPVGKQVFTKYFHLITTNKCEGDFEVDVQFVQCNHSGKMAWAHNDALLEAYKDGMDYFYMALQWRHNEHTSVSNHQPNDYLLNGLFGRRTKVTSKLRVTGLCVGNSPGTGEFPAQKASYAENVSIWWRHHGKRWYHHDNTQLD